MRRKCVAIGFFFLLIGTTVLPLAAQDIGTSMVHTSHTSSRNTERNHDRVLQSIFGLESIIFISWGNVTVNPLEPGGAPRIVNFTVQYLTSSGSMFFGKLILLYCIETHQHVTVSFEIGDVPSWCHASLSSSELQFPISRDILTQHVSLSVAVDEDAPAYALCPVPIQASVDTLRGPFGFLPLIYGYQGAFTIVFIPGYRPSISVIPASEYMNVTPGNTSHLHISITNTGNAKTAVYTELVDFPSGDWLISLPSQVILEVNESCDICLSVVPPSDFSGTESITITFTPYKADDHTHHGEPVLITIVVICEP